MNTPRTGVPTATGTLTRGVGPSTYLICGAESAENPRTEWAPGRSWAVTHAAATGHGQFLEVSLRCWTPGFDPPPPALDTGPGTALMDHSRPLDW